MSFVSQKDYESLVEKVNNYSYLYHVKHTPQISDIEYDKLFAQLKDIEKDNPSWVLAESPTQRVGSDLLEGFGKFEHKTPMLSLDNTYTKEEIFGFAKRVSNIFKAEPDDIVFDVEIKIDGIAASIIYLDGYYFKAATRGDGTIGDDITENVKTVKSVPMRLHSERFSKGEVEVRGELFIDYKTFAKINSERGKMGLQLFANPRNAAAGSVKMLDTKQVAQRGLKFIAYSIAAEPEILNDSHFENMNGLSLAGFMVNPFIQKCGGVQEVVEWCEKLESMRGKFEFPVDGAVIKLDSLKLREIAGTTTKDYKWAISYKFKAEVALAKIIKIEHSMGRLGTVTPVAKFDKVWLSGTWVSSASLHNYEEVKRLDVAEGDMVYVEKSGEIIPQIVSVEKRQDGRKGVEVPVICPICSTQLVKYKEAAIRCPNLKCPDKLFRQIVHFSSKAGCDIDGLGPGVVKRLIDEKVLADITDIYRLKHSDIVGLDGFGEKSASQLIGAVKKSLSSKPHRLLYALGIENVGAKNAEVVCRHIDDLLNLRDIDVERLVLIDDIGPITAASIKKYFEDSENFERLLELKNFGFETVCSSYKEDSDKRTGFFAGKRVVITGSLGQYTREQVKDILKNMGADVSDSVSRSTDFLIAGENSGSKYKKATELGIEIISEENFIEIMNNENRHINGEQEKKSQQGGAQLKLF